MHINNLHNAVNYLLLLSSSTVLCIMLLSTNIAYADWINIEENSLRKKGSQNIIEIDGQISRISANMTVIYPDDTRTRSQIEVTKQGVINTYIILPDSAPSGLYIVEIHPYNDTMRLSRSSTLTSYFFLSNYDGLLHLDIKRNAAIGCKTAGINISDDCLTPAHTRIPLTFGMRFWNNDYRTHQMNIDGAITDLILPDGDGIVFPTKKGEIDYRCMIHPWIGGHVQVLDISTLRYSSALLTSPNVTDTIAGTIKDTIPDVIHDNSNRPNIPLVQPTYDTSCSLCWTGIVTGIDDGDTLFVDDKTVRLSLVSVPYNKQGNDAATAYTTSICPVGMRVLVDPNDMAPKDKFGRFMAKVTCGDTVLNESLYKAGLAEIRNYSCKSSEFAIESWAADSCPQQQPDNPKTKPRLDPPSIINDTISSNITDIIINSTNSTGITPDNQDMEIIFISIIGILLAVTICLVIVMKRMGHTTKTMDTFEILE